MIWMRGKIVPADELTLSPVDRIFEHGLGLFETFRTWDGRALLLDRHLARLQQSSRDLSIPLNPLDLPDHADVTALLAASRLRDALIRLTVSGGNLAELPALVWMTARPLPSMADLGSGWRVQDASWTVAVDDPLARHKTLNYWLKRLAHEQAIAAGWDEAIFKSADGRVWEGSRTSLFLVRGRTLITPPTSGPIIPGVKRQLVLELARFADFDVEEVDVSSALIAEADEVFLTNSVRGLIPVRSWMGRFEARATREWPQTRRLEGATAAYLNQARPHP